MFLYNVQPLLLVCKYKVEMHTVVLELCTDADSLIQLDFDLQGFDFNLILQ